MGFTRNRHRKGQSKKLSPCAVRQVQKLASKNRCISAASIALEVAEVEGQLVGAQTIRHTLQQVSLHSRRPRRKPLLKLAHKKACKQFAEDNLAKSKMGLQDGAAMFGRRPGRSAKTVLLFTFLLTFDFSFYTHNVCTDHLRQKYTLGHWKPLH